MHQNTYTVEKAGEFNTLNRYDWAAAVTSVYPEARPISWRIVRAPVPYTLFEVSNTQETGYILVNGNIKVYRHKC